MLLIIFQIERDISHLTQDQMTVAVYYTRLKQNYRMNWDPIIIPFVLMGQTIEDTD